MEGYKHYVRLNEQGSIIKRFSDAFEQPQTGDICIAENAGRHYNDSVFNERLQYTFKWDGTAEVLRSQAELDAEWSARPPEPPSIADKVAHLQAESVDNMLALTEVYETAVQQDATRGQEGLDTVLALTEAYELILQQQATIDALTVRIDVLEGGAS